MAFLPGFHAIVGFVFLHSQEYLPVWVLYDIIFSGTKESNVVKRPSKCMTPIAFGARYRICLIRA